MTTDITHDMLSHLKMGFLRTLHKFAYNANGMCNVGASFSEKKELTNKHPVEGSINRRGGGVF
jgi:hypothetical protein